jgi:hypothetical protein
MLLACLMPPGFLSDFLSAFLRISSQLFMHSVLLHDLPRALDFSLHFTAKGPLLMTMSWVWGNAGDVFECKLKFFCFWVHLFSFGGGNCLTVQKLLCYIRRYIPEMYSIWDRRAPALGTSSSKFTLRKAKYPLVLHWYRKLFIPNNKMCVWHGVCVCVCVFVCLCVCVCVCVCVCLTCVRNMTGVWHSF